MIAHGDEHGIGRLWPNLRERANLSLATECNSALLAFWAFSRSPGPGECANTIYFDSGGAGFSAMTFAKDNSFGV